MWKFLILLGLFGAAWSFPSDYASSYEDEHAEELANEFQGDMIISQEELDSFNGRIDENLRWKDLTVPYTINMTFFSEYHRLCI